MLFTGDITKYHKIPNKDSNMLVYTPCHLLDDYFLQLAVHYHLQISPHNDGICL